MRDIPNVDRVRAYSLDRQVVHFFHGFRAAVHIHIVFKGANFYCSGGQNQVLRAHCGDHVARRKAFRLELSDIQVHLDLALLASVGVREDGTLYGRQLVAQEIRCQVVQLLLGKIFSGKRELNNRDRGCVVLQDKRRGCARRILPEGRLRDRRDLRHGHFNSHVGIEKNLDDAEPVQGLRFDVLDIIDCGGKPALENDDQSLRDIFGRKSRIPVHDAEHRNIDIRENIDGRRVDRQRPENQDQQGHHHKGVRPSQC